MLDCVSTEVEGFMDQIEEHAVQVDLRLSLAVAQGEFARYRRTGGLIHLAHASRALADAQKALDEVRQRALAVRLRSGSPS